jgi:hypothetical protein
MVGKRLTPLVIGRAAPSAVPGCRRLASRARTTREPLAQAAQKGVTPTLMSLGAIRRKNRQMKELSDDLFHT